MTRTSRSRLGGHLDRRERDIDLVVTVVVAAEQLDAFGVVAESASLRPFASYLKETFEDRLLNDVLGPDPSNERFAQHLGRWFVDNVEHALRARLRSVRVAQASGPAGVWERPAP